MPWALVSGEDYAQITTLPAASANITFEATVKFSDFNNSYNQVFSGTQTNEFASDYFALGVRSTGMPFACVGGVTARYIAGTSALSTGTIYKLTLVCTGMDTVNPGSAQGNMELFVDDVSVATGVVPNSALFHNPADSVPYLGCNASGRSFNGNFYSGRMVADTGVTYDYQWSADASTHTTGQPILVSTADANNFVGQNFPTDGSAWVEEGGDVTPPAWNVSPTVQATSGTGHTIRSSINEGGDIFAVRLATGAAAPSVAQVIAGNDSTDSPAPEAKSALAVLADANTDFVFSTGAPATGYDYHFAARDTAGNAQAAITTLTNQVTSGAALVITGGDLTPGTTSSGTYSGIADLARVVLTDSQGNTLDTDVDAGFTITDYGSGNFDITMPTLPTTGSKNLLLLGTVTAVGYQA